jgi:hypothetical protein
MGWDERDALKHWAVICGPTGMSPYLHTFLLNEIELLDISEINKIQATLERLFNHLLKQGMPMELVLVTPFKEALFHSRNAEETLLVVLNACARVTTSLVKIVQPNPTSFGGWFRRIQGQRSGPESALVARCLSFMDLSGFTLDISDFYAADFRHSNLSGIKAHYSCFARANLSGANLMNAILQSANCEGTDFKRANLSGADLSEANCSGAKFTDAKLTGARVSLDFVRPSLSVEQKGEIETVHARFQQALKRSEPLTKEVSPQKKKVGRIK